MEVQQLKLSGCSSSLIIICNAILIVCSCEGIQLVFIIDMTSSRQNVDLQCEYLSCGEKWSTSTLVNQKYRGLSVIIIKMMEYYNSMVQSPS